jgi:hypothetical protein
LNGREDDFALLELIFIIRLAYLLRRPHRLTVFLGFGIVYFQKNELEEEK